MGMKKKEINYQLLIRRICLIVLDIICIIAASILALLTRFEFDFSQIPKEFLKVIYKYGPFTIVITLIIFSLFRIYSSLWEYAGIEEVFSLIAACLAAAVAKIVIILFTWSVMPRSWYVLDTIYLMILIGATRVSYRLIRLRRQNRTFPWSKRKKVMIIGGGEAGRSLITEIQNSKYLDQKVVCIIDDDPYKIGRYIKGVKVVGNRNSIKKSVKKYNVQQIILTIPSANAAKIRPIVEICQDTNCELMILPGVYQLVNGEVKASKLRPVNIDDLLGRDEVHVNLNEVMDYVSGRVIMVTGGGGSIGSELCRQIAKHSPKQLIIFDIYENNAYDIQQELLREQPKLDLVVLIGSVRDENRINSIFEQYRPEIIYHAAAHKHVPLMEGSPNEAIKNNVLGTYNMVRMADKWNAKRFVQISTDKAVNPTNIMGASKRICEMIIQTYNKESNTEYVAVRFGNVLGSNGSVIPLFKKQIAEGGPVTVTHPEIIRYFMTIPEAVSLVLQAGAYAKGGEIFVLDMGEPVKILDLARNMIRLSGYKVDQDIKIEFTGLRPGEKKERTNENGSLHVIFGGAPDRENSLLIGSGRMRALIKALKSKYDIIILDTAPSELLADAPLLGKYVDAALYVIRYDYTKLREIREGVESLALSGIDMLGYVFNGDNSSGGQGYGYGYRRYGNYGSYGSHYGSYGKYGAYGHYGKMEKGSTDKFGRVIKD